MRRKSVKSRQTQSSAASLARCSRENRGEKSTSSCRHPLKRLPVDVDRKRPTCSLKAWSDFGSCLSAVRLHDPKRTRRSSSFHAMRSISICVRFFRGLFQKPRTRSVNGKSPLSVRDASSLAARIMRSKACPSMVRSRGRKRFATSDAG